MKLLKIAEASEQSGISKFTLYRLVKEGKLRIVHLPGRRSFFIDPRDLEAMIEASKTGEVPTVGPEFDSSSGPLFGPIGPKQVLQVQENTRQPKTTENSKNGDKYEWIQRYTRK